MNAPHKWSRSTRIERKLAEAEYLIDSTNTHVRRSGCDDVKPLSLERYSRALNAVRSSLALLREDTQIKHLTLFAGKAGKGKPDPKWDRGYSGQKPWGSAVPHKWMKDCQVVKMLDPEIEKGKVAECWHCDEVFTKKTYCPECGFYICPSCNKCACQLPPETRRMLEKTVRAMAGIGGVPLSK